MMPLSMPAKKQPDRNRDPHHIRVIVTSLFLLSSGALLTVGLAFDCQLLRQPIPVGPTDRKLTSLVTQRRVYDCSKSGEPQMFK